MFLSVLSLLDNSFCTFAFMRMSISLKIMIVFIIEYYQSEKLG